MNAHAPPAGLLAELTHRCPLACPYCSNPRELIARDAELDTRTWERVFSQAAEIGVLHVHLSGGEPLARRDLPDLVRHCASVGLYSNLITSGIGLTRDRLDTLANAGLDHLQLSIQDVDPGSADRIANYAGAFEKKREVAGWVTGTGLPLTVNIVVHRANVMRVKEMVAFAIALGARRVEIAHAQYYGWALLNRRALMPREEDARAAIETIEDLRKAHDGTIVIDHVIPDYFARFPKACMNGWGRRTLNVTPSGRVLPCHAAETIPGLEFWSVQDHSLADIWRMSPAFEAFRGTAWMQSPCATCERREIDFGGCRCQALALTGDARNTDPVCSRSPRHADLVALAMADASAETADYIYRTMR